MSQQASPRSSALTLSIVFGVLGVVLILVGFAVRSTPIDVAGTVAGAISLLSALYWRSQLVADWHEKH
ncbi:MAG: hypothetical protein JOZ37_09020 [Actinobacteria bacterium]|nr:hypothetical protein [Actinomycetota bacterium]MBV8957341.1 hypothetical protein [Actinomycetota bacterium]MBV9664095.1 hypothetical protein [Actinomycetota bacterium]